SLNFLPQLGEIIARFGQGSAIGRECENGQEQEEQQVLDHPSGGVHWYSAHHRHEDCASFFPNQSKMTRCRSTRCRGRPTAANVGLSPEKRTNFTSLRSFFSATKNCSA